MVNPELDYCQGMNFIAGFLYLFLKDEALSFAVIRQIINFFELSTLFNTELPMLKLNFYRLDRLISILLPDLHSHFKVSNPNDGHTVLFNFDRRKASTARTLARPTLSHFLRKLCSISLPVQRCGNYSESGTIS